MDRRRAFPKWCEKNADFALAGGDGDDAGEALAGVALAEAKSLGTSFAPGALELLLQKVGANTRLIVEETRKLSAYAQPLAPAAPTGLGGRIEETHVAELTPNVAAGDFFEAAEAFFSGELDHAKLNFVDRLLAQAVEKSTQTPAGDFRDWSRIRAWAQTVFA